MSRSPSPTPSHAPTPSRVSPEARAILGVVAFSLGFSALIWLLGGRLERVPHLPDAGASWYYWKLPQPTAAARWSAWGLYLAHQLTAWGFIVYAQRRVRRYTAGLKPWNWWALGAHALFIGLHLLQTHLFYDGLAQDVSIWSSQASVIVLLIWVLLMENDRRGLAFGARLPLPRRVGDFARRYHGYFFAWAVVYTFWYHPTEATTGHLWGFFYTTLLLLQGGLVYTRAHVNRWWTLTLEVVVLAHGALVAVAQGNGMWPMFAFGFGGVFVITQMHGLPLGRAARAGIAALYVALALWVYGDRGLAGIHQIAWIPLIDYLGVLLLAGLFGLALAAARGWRRLRAAG